MSLPSPPSNVLAHVARQHNGHGAAAPRPVPDELAARRRRGHELPHESTNDQERGERLAREVLHQQLIEATFDRAESYERLGDFEKALQWLDRATALSGGVPASYQDERARWAQVAARRAEPSARAWKDDTQRPE
jgi:hypothetical protein